MEVRLQGRIIISYAIRYAIGLYATLQSELKDYNIIIDYAEDVRPSSKRRSDFPQLFLPLLMTSRSNGRMELVRVTEQVRFLSSHF